jgi:succinylglutamic semialdehyde dehydrogenase
VSFPLSKEIKMMTTFHSTNPATGEILWEEPAASPTDVGKAVERARKAFHSWARLPFEKRVEYVEAFRSQLEANKVEIATAISQETGKPLWDSLTEVAAMIGKVAISIQAYHERTGYHQREINGMQARLLHKPHGVMAVFGPYNFPAHLPNGHIVPALLAGNTAVFKPSNVTPMVAEKTIELWHKAGLPEGVLQVVQGQRETGVALASHPDIDGLLFTGSSGVGQSLHKQYGGQTHKILALEMGGNNPLIIWDPESVEAAAYHNVLSSFISTGQRCTCARRLIIKQGAEGDAYLEALLAQTAKLRIGAYADSPEPFMGPLVRNLEVDQILAAQENLQKLGGKVLLKAGRLNDKLPFISPGIIDVTAVKTRNDADLEYFGPFLQVTRVNTFEEAIAAANNTEYGLASAIFTQHKELYEQCLIELRAGLVNWNRQTTGASSALPFGGVGISGNHRPAAYYAADYCAYPVAALESETLTIPATLNAGIER